MKDKIVLIVGGGIGGLAAALRFSRQGFAVRIFEQGSGETGAGIQLGPNSTRLLFDLGLEEPLRAVASLPTGIEMRDWKRGRMLATTTLGETTVRRYGFPYLHVHRADLMRVLATAVQGQCNIELHPNTTVTAVGQDQSGVCLEAGGGQFSGDLLVGADGIRSMVRESLFGPESPTFTGNIAWRAMVPASQLPKDLIRPVATAWWGPGKHLVHYPVGRGEHINCVGVVEKAGWETESWNEPGDIDELQSDFAGWHDNVRTMIARVDPDTLYKWALFDRPPMPAWGRGRMTLLGDACHPTLPFMAQGAAMAIEDGVVLSRCLQSGMRQVSQQGEDDTAAFVRYQNLRQKRTAAVQRGSRRNGKVYHLSGPAAWLRNRVVKHAAQRRTDWLFRYNALGVEQ